MPLAAPPGVAALLISVHILRSTPAMFVGKQLTFQFCFIVSKLSATLPVNISLSIRLDKED